MKTVKEKNKRALAVICACMPVLIVTLDQLTKYLVRVFMQVGDSVSVLGEFFRLTYVLNDGMAFGLGGGWRWVFMILTPVALTAVAILFFKKYDSLRPLTLVSMTMIFGGGLSNMIDRIFFYHLSPESTGLFDGRVVDFFDFNITVFGKRIWNAVFNVADAFVVVGVFTLAVMLLFFEMKEKAPAGGQPAAEEDQSESGGQSEGGDQPENGDGQPEGGEQPESGDGQSESGEQPTAE